MSGWDAYAVGNVQSARELHKACRTIIGYRLCIPMRGQTTKLLSPVVWSDGQSHTLSPGGVSLPKPGAGNGLPRCVMLAACTHDPCAGGAKGNPYKKKHDPDVRADSASAVIGCASAPIKKTPVPGVKGPLQNRQMQARLTDFPIQKAQREIQPRKRAI